METVELHGIKLELDPAILSAKMIQVIRERRYEGAEARQLQRVVQENEIVLEIGAGIGFISSLLVKNPKTKKVISYEANPGLIDAIRKTVSSNAAAEQDKWEVRNAVLANGLWDKDFINFYVHADFWGSSLEPSAHAVRVEQVRLQRFNTLIPEMRPTMIVCDIEGGELELFRNADLTGVKKVYLEIHQGRLGRRGIRALFDCFHAHDFAYDQHHSEGSVVLFSHIDR